MKTARIEITEEAATAVVALLGEHDFSTAQVFAAETEVLLGIRARGSSLT